MAGRGQPGQGKAKAHPAENSLVRNGVREMGLKGVDARTEAQMSFCTMPGSRACILQTVMLERKDTIKRCEALQAQMCLINSPNKYFRGSRHRASKNAEQQALWRPPWTEWTGVGVGQRPSWLSGALAAQVSHLLGPFPAPGSPRCPPSVAQKGCHGASSLLLEEPWHLP